MFAAFESKLIRELGTTKRSIEEVGMQWNEKKCAVTHVRRGALDQSTSEIHAFGANTFPNMFK